jgi:hypothetical protein
VTAKEWTDSGQRHDPRGLEQRDPDAMQIVPIPPWLQSLREHIDQFGTAPDGRQFRNKRDRIIGSTTAVSGPQIVGLAGRADWYFWGLADPGWSVQARPHVSAAMISGRVVRLFW